MKKGLILAIVISVVASFSLLIRDTSAERVLTQEQMNTISRTCKTVQSELRLLDASDVLVRTNIGQRYENIMTSLISPLNSRLSLNQVDNIDLVKTSVDYNDALSEFRKSYFVYENSLVDAIDTDCESSPVEFYTAIEIARKNRKELQQSVKKLNGLLTKFQKDFRVIKTDWIKVNG